MAKRDILDEMSKQELIDWIRNRHFVRPKRSEVLYMRWERQSAQVLEEMQQENRALDGIDLAERDRLARQFNETKNSKEKLRLIKLISPYHKAVADHHKRTRAINAKQKSVDALYQQIDLARRAEQ